MTSSILPHVCGTNPAKGLFTRLIAQSEPVKTCTKCGESKAVADFSKDKGKKDGYRPDCKACNAAYYAAKKDSVRERSAAWRKANPERVRERNTAYYAANPERMRELVAAWQKANPERKRAIDAAWRAANPEHVRKASAAWQKANPERVRGYSAAWKAANPESKLIHRHTRRARKRQSGGKLTRGITEKLLKLQHGKCACCHADLGKTGCHLDHVMPLALGGSNTDDNVQLLCPSCNLSKHAKHPVDFMQSRGFLL